MITVLKFPVPAAMNGDALVVELAAAGVTARVSVNGDALEIVTQSPQETVALVLAAHIPPPPAPNPYEELSKAVQSATTLAGLRAVLLGTVGPGIQPRIGR